MTMVMMTAHVAALAWHVPMRVPVQVPTLVPRAFAAMDSIPSKVANPSWGECVLQSGDAAEQQKREVP